MLDSEFSNAAIQLPLSRRDPFVQKAWIGRKTPRQNTQAWAELRARKTKWIQGLIKFDGNILIWLGSRLDDIFFFDALARP